MDYLGSLIVDGIPGSHSMACRTDAADISLPSFRILNHWAPPLIIELKLLNVSVKSPTVHQKIIDAPLGGQQSGVFF